MNAFIRVARGITYVLLPAETFFIAVMSMTVVGIDSLLIVVLFLTLSIASLIPLAAVIILLHPMPSSEQSSEFSAQTRQNVVPSLLFVSGLVLMGLVAWALIASTTAGILGTSP